MKDMLSCLFVTAWLMYIAVIPPTLANVWLLIHEESRVLVPTISRKGGGVSVVSYNQTCLEDCPKQTTTPSTLPAIRFEGNLSANYCPLKLNCQGEIYLTALYNGPGPSSLVMNITLLDEGKKIKASITCLTAGRMEIWMNSTNRMRILSLEWNVSQINENNGWYIYKSYQTGNHWMNRWRWRGHFWCGGSVKPTITTVQSSTAVTHTTSRVVSSISLPTSVDRLLPSMSGARVFSSSPDLSSTIKTSDSLQVNETTGRGGARVNHTTIYSSAAGGGAAVVIICMIIIIVIIRKRRRKKKSAHGRRSSTIVDSTSTNPSQLTCKYDSKRSTVGIEFNLPSNSFLYSNPMEGQSNPTQKSQIPTYSKALTPTALNELYTEVKKTSKKDTAGDGAHIAENPRHSSAVQNPDVHHNNGSSLEVLSNLSNSMYAVVKKPNGRCGEGMTPIPRVTMMENDIYGT